MKTTILILVLLFIASGLYAVDSLNVRLTGHIDTPGATWGVHVVGDYAYVADDYAGLQIIDISTPSAPSLTGTYDTGDNAYGVYVSGSYAYVTDGNNGLYILDVSHFTEE